MRFSIKAAGFEAGFTRFHLAANAIIPIIGYVFPSNLHGFHVGFTRLDGPWSIWLSLKGQEVVSVGGHFELLCKQSAQLLADDGFAEFFSKIQSFVLADRNPNRVKCLYTFSKDYELARAFFYMWDGAP